MKVESIFRVAPARIITAALVCPSLAASVHASFVGSADFDTANNPSASGNWQYGYTTSLGGAFTLHAQTVTYGVLMGWGSFSTGDGNPSVIKNTTNSNVSGGTPYWAPLGLSLHPGAFGEFSVLRFVAPNTGTYTLDASFADSDVVGTTSDVHVLVNNLSVFDDVINFVGDSTSYSQSVFLTAGDTVDLSVGYGLNGNFSFDTTAVELEMTLVPEPTTLFACAAGIAFFSRRRRWRIQ